MRHFIEELERLRGQLLEMGGLVETAVRQSIRALTGRDPAPARQVLADEARINRMQIEIDDSAVRLIALHQPMAGDLRLLTAAIKINSDLERMGDLAVNIAERSLSLMKQAPVKPLIDMPKLADLTESMVHKSLDSFVRKDAAMAREVLTSDDAVDELRDTIYQELIGFMERDPTTISRSLDLLFVARNLERIADHATNIAEDVVFLVQGVDVRHHAEA